ncbi:MAG: AAA family ATPase, partial [Oscillatoria sp. PMC 1076.18]|nr:AAA family ATPase [Oscillatoria sp. PMC 1076.18]
MLKLSGYKIFSKISESRNSIVYRGERERDRLPVILKVLNRDYPIPQELTRYNTEYNLTANLNIDNVVKTYEQKKYRNSPVLVTEDFGGESLNKLLKKQIFTLPYFLETAIKITEILAQIHTKNIIHKDLNPSNLVLNIETHTLKLIDFGIATILNRENPTISHPNVLEGTLAYISPEQTGRMNRSLDYRSDFYSLGVTLYELITHQLPFQTSDAMELVHCHLAVIPTPPHQIKPEIPQVVSDIIMKLLAKTAEERYQSSWGIKADLEKCLQQLKKSTKITKLTLAKDDISDKFQIPQKLYGRKAEIHTLLAAFDRISVTPESSSTTLKTNIYSAQEINNSKPEKAKVEMMLVAGYSGIGKSALVAEIHKPITRSRGYFIAGKFDQFQRNIPYSAVVSAFSGLVRQLLTESEAQLKIWQEKLVQALGQLGQVIIDVIPEVELIIGKQPPVPKLGATESQNRFNLVFLNFLRVFCQPKHPLVIFLDDLQWADSATLKLIQLIMTEVGLEYLFLIGAYRDNEVNATHPLTTTIDNILQAGATINQITLAPLELEHICHLIADTLHSDSSTVQPLAELVVRKTEGNPFFVNEFLKTLHAENLITFNPQQVTENKRSWWQWNIEHIQAMDITENVVELMIGKLKKLPRSTQKVLQLAACVGASFELSTIAIISEQSPTTTFENLLVGIQSGLILPISELDVELLIQEHKFLHDRVQQAAYALIDEGQKTAVHLQIGTLLLENLDQQTMGKQATPSVSTTRSIASSKAIADKIFDIVKHLNIGAVLVTNQQKRDEIAQLNLIAGRKAKSSTAYTAAVEYFSAGIAMLAQDCWTNQYELTHSLHEEAAEAAYLCGNFDLMEQLVEVVLQQGKTVLDQTKVYEVKIQAYAAQNKLLEAVNTALVILKLLGVEFPEKPTPAYLNQELEKINLKLVSKNTQDLVELPEMSDPDKLAAMRILSSVWASTYLGVPELMPLNVLQQVNLSLDYGNTTISAFSYATYGLVLCAFVGDFDLGYQFGQLALKVVNKFHAKELEAKTFEIVNSHVRHYKEHINNSLKPLLLGYHSGIETGDLEFTGYCAYLHFSYAYFCGKELNNLQTEMLNYCLNLQKLKQQTALGYLQIYRQAVLNLLGKTTSTYRLLGDAYNEEIQLPIQQKNNDLTAINYCHLNKLVLCYLFENYSEAVENANLVETYLDAVPALIFVPIFYFYDSLTQLAVYPDQNQSTQEKILEKVAANQKKLQELAHHAPMNHLHKYELVEAEKARILEQKWEATELYERAIQGANKNNYIQEEALAYELAGKFYLTQGMEKFAQNYLTEARYCYLTWGATAKVEYFSAKYPQLEDVGASAKNKATIDTKTTVLSSDSNSWETLDLATVIQASQAISGEIFLDKLLAKLMKICIENAGAQKGILLMAVKGNLLKYATASVDRVSLVVQDSPFIDDCRDVPVSVIKYVERSRENVVLNNAAVEGQFIDDAYISHQKLKSLLCTPIVNAGKLIGILYLENNLTVGAFTANRLQVLQVLSSQAAISLENALLYANLEEKVAERTQEIKQKNRRLSETLKELQRTQTQLIQTEKMSSLGQMVAGLAHELNNPVNFISGNIN